MLTSKEMIAVAVQALDSKKGKDIRVLYTEEQTSLADYFVICNGTSSTQVRALADAVEEALSKKGEEPHHVEGHRGGEWTLLDYACVVVQIRHEIIAVILLGTGRPIFDGAQIGTQSQITAGFNTGEHYFLLRLFFHIHNLLYVLVQTQSSVTHSLISTGSASDHRRSRE